MVQHSHRPRHIRESDANDADLGLSLVASSFEDSDVSCACPLQYQTNLTKRPSP